MYFNKKRNYSESFNSSSNEFLSLRNTNDNNLIKERKKITILEPKSLNNPTSQKEEFNEETMKLINELKNQYNLKSNFTNLNDIDKAKNQSTNLQLSSSTGMINPFLSQTTENKSEAPKMVNPFLMSVNNSTMPTWNFNFNLMQNINPPFEKEDRDIDEDEDDDYEDPEIEVEIKPTNETNNFPVVKIKNGSEKYAYCFIDQLSIYDFNIKKYKEKGKGKLSLELFRGQTNKGVIVFRPNDGMPILFQGSVYDITTIEKSKKANTWIVVINKVITPNDEQKVNALQIKFSSFKDEERFIANFNKFKEEIKSNNGKKSNEEKEKDNATAIIHPPNKSKMLNQTEITSKSKSEKVKSHIEPITNQNSTIMKNPFLEYINSSKDKESNSSNTTNQEIKNVSSDHLKQQPPVLINPFLQANNLFNKKKEANDSNNSNQLYLPLNPFTNPNTNDNLEKMEEKEQRNNKQITRILVKPRSDKNSNN